MKKTYVTLNFALISLLNVSCGTPSSHLPSSQHNKNYSQPMGKIINAENAQGEGLLDQSLIFHRQESNIGVNYYCVYDTTKAELRDNINLATGQRDPDSGIYMTPMRTVPYGENEIISVINSHPVKTMFSGAMGAALGSMAFYVTNVMRSDDQAKDMVSQGFKAIPNGTWYGAWGLAALAGILSTAVPLIIYSNTANFLKQKNSVRVAQNTDYQILKEKLLALENPDFLDAAGDFLNTIRGHQPKPCGPLHLTMSPTGQETAEETEEKSPDPTLEKKIKWEFQWFKSLWDGLSQGK